MDDLPTRIRAWREEAQLSQAELAGILGVHYTAVWQWENAKCSPSVARLEAIAKACGTNMRSFWGRLPEQAAE